MRSLEQRARARLGDLLLGFELEAVENLDVLSARFTARDGERTASVCILHERWVSLPGFASSFARAAWLTQTFDHIVVPKVLDSGVTEDRLPYVVLEPLGSETLATYIARRADTVPPAEALRIAGLLADGLAALGRQGGVHAALQPEAIALTDTGAARLLHLGWTRLREQAAAHLGHSGLPRLSGYLSPSQARGDSPTPQDDLWSLASMLYELLSGKPLRSGEADEDRLTESRHWEAPSLSAACAGAHEALVELLDRALHPVATERFQSAQEFGARCRLIATYPDIARMRRLNTLLRPPSAPVRVGGPKRQGGSPSHSGVAPLNLPEQATGTLSPSGGLPSPSPRASVGRYSSADLRVDTLHPKKA